MGKFEGNSGFLPREELNRLRGKHGDLQYQIEDLEKKSNRTSEEERKLQELHEEQDIITQKILQNAAKLQNL